MIMDKAIDGYVKEIQESDLVVGNVLRMFNDDECITSSPFSDCLITKVEDGIVYFARPMGFIAEYGNSVYLHHESFSAFADTLNKKRFRVVMRYSKNGNVPANMKQG